MIQPTQLAHLGDKYTLVLCEDDETGERMSLATDDPDFALLLFIESPQAIRSGVELPWQKFPIWRAGWPTAPDGDGEFEINVELEAELDAAFAFEAGPWRVSRQRGVSGHGGPDDV